MTTPDVRLEGSDTAADRLCADLDDARPSATHDPRRTVTSEQVDQAVRQLRERPGRPAAEQVQAVLRALDLTVVPGNEHRC